MRELWLRAPYRVIDAHHGKLVRAEPISLLYETGEVHHVGRFPELEEQLVNWTGACGQRSPDRRGRRRCLRLPLTNAQAPQHRESVLGEPWVDLGDRSKCRLVLEILVQALPAKLLGWI
jgi:hypothetical protein